MADKYQRNNRRNRKLSNAVKLSGRELIITLAILVPAVFWGIPAVWQHFETVELGTNYRLDNRQRDNYYLYEQTVKAASREFEVLFLGDSVVWGMYVDSANTLPALLNRRIGREVIGNIAVDGLHCVAMETLVDRYCKNVQAKRVLLYFNPLWITTPLYDLSSDQEFGINHPRLLPQFFPRIASSRASFSERMGVLTDRHIPFFGWLNHLRVSFFGNEDLKRVLATNFGTFNPLASLRLHLAPGEKVRTNGRIDWYNGGLPEQDWSWVNLDGSRQWKSFLATISRLKSRNNSVCVVIGSINPHMQTKKSLDRYRELRREIEQHLRELSVETVMLPDLPSAEYADASHPLAAGYARIANTFDLNKIYRSQGEKNI